jgi:allantoin racemase
MRILIINPNSDADMTEAIQASAEAYAGGEFDVVTLPTPEAPRFLETYEDEIRSGPGMLRIIRENEPDYDAFIVACHSDSNIHAARELTTKPVIGIGEASMTMATFLGHGFSVVTTHQHSVHGKLRQVRALNLQDLLVSIRAPEEGDEGWSDETMFMELSRRAMKEDGAEVIVLGCAGLSGMDRTIQAELNIPVLDGVACALIIATGLARYGVGTSKVLGYNPDY